MIYILGSNDLSLYLACKIKESNNNVCIVTNKIPPQDKKQITIKEEGKFNKKTTSIDVINHPKEDVQYLIISADIKDLRTELSTLATQKLKKAKIICLSGIKNSASIEPLLKEKPSFAYIQAYITSSQESITILGSNPKLITSKKTDQEFVEIFLKAGFDIEEKETQQQAFWSWFSTFSILYLLHCHSKKNIIELLKTQEQRQKIEVLAQEISTIAKKEIKEDIKEATITNIYSTPNNIKFPFSFAKLNFINEVIKKHHPKENELNKLIKTIYNKKLI